MNSAISRIVSIHRYQCRILSNYLPKRNIQEFPATRLDNSAHQDYFLVLPEITSDPNNQLAHLSKIGIGEIDFRKINVENAYIGLSKAICSFENFLTDLENNEACLYKSPEDMFKDIEKYLYPMDSAYNIVMALISAKTGEFLFQEVGALLKRYHSVREKRFTGAIEDALKDFDIQNDAYDQADKKMIYLYKTESTPTRRPMDSSTIIHLRKNLKHDIEQFSEKLRAADSLISHTVDDPDIIAAIANEYNHCQDLRHKERTPLKVTVSTYQKFMRACPDRFMRRMLWETYHKRCSPKALPRLNTHSLQMSIRVARRQIAECLGYRTHLDLRLRNTMAQNKENVLRSLQSIHQDNKPKLDNCLKELNEFANDHQFSDPAGIQEYDCDYWSHRYNSDVLIGMSQQQLTSYFPLQSVLEGIKDFFSRYLSMEISTNKQARSKLWTPEAQFLDLRRNGELLGNIIFDPFQNGFRQNNNTVYAKILSRVPDTKNTTTRLISVPYVQEANLSIADVMNLFYCFSLAVQDVFYDYKYYELNACSALEPDCLNLLPYLCYGHMLNDDKIIRSMSSRNCPIDSELAARIIKSIHHLRPLKIWKELYLAHLDLQLYSAMSRTKDVADEIYKIYSPFERCQDDFDYCAMDELFIGPNDGVKYANLWARQLANSCLMQLDTNNSDKMKEFYGKFVDLHFDPDSLVTKTKLLKLFESGFESTKSGLGVL